MAFTKSAAQRTREGPPSRGKNLDDLRTTKNLLDEFRLPTSTYVKSLEALCAPSVVSTRPARLMSIRSTPPAGLEGCEFCSHRPYARKSRPRRLSSSLTGKGTTLVR